MHAKTPFCLIRLKHYAGSVTYTVTGFVDKNNDLLFRDLSQAMYRCNHPILKELFPEGIFWWVAVIWPVVKNVSFYSRKSAPGHSQTSRYGRKPIQSLRQRSDEESEHQDASLRALHQTERSETGQLVRGDFGAAPGPLLGSHGERSRPQSRIRIPPDLQRIPATLQDDVGPNVARLVGHLHRRRGPTFARSAHLGHRVRLWQDENFHQKPAHGKVAAPMASSVRFIRPKEWGHLSPSLDFRQFQIVWLPTSQFPCLDCDSKYHTKR